MGPKSAFLLTLAFLASLSAPALEFTPDCVRTLVQELIGEDAYFMDRAADSPRFRAYLRAKRIAWDGLGDAAKASLLEDYLNQYFRRFAADGLAVRRSRALGTAPREHGLEFRGDPYRALKTLSRRNLNRLLPERYAFGETPAMAEAEKIVNGILFALPHNVKNAVSALPEGLLLSSRQLRRIGTGGGLNSRLPFTREFMGQEDQVFFFADVLHPKYPYPSSQYGDYGYLLDPNLAQDQGWVSAFVMYPEDLYGAARRLLSETEFGALEKAERASRAPWAGAGGRFRNLFEFTPEQRAAWTQAKRALQKADFTLEDYRTLVREKILRNLNAMRIRDPNSFAAWMAILRDPGTHAAGRAAGWDAFLENVLFKPSGLPRSFEFKVPVAVDPKDLTLRRRGMKYVPPKTAPPD